MSSLWLTGAQMKRLRLYSPESHGRPRVDDPRVPSGLNFINRDGATLRRNIGHLAAVFDEGGLRLLPNGLGEVMSPSAVGLADDGRSLLVDRAARAPPVRHLELSAAWFQPYIL